MYVYFDTYYNALAGLQFRFYNDKVDGSYIDSYLPDYKFNGASFLPSASFYKQN